MKSLLSTGKTIKDPLIERKKHILLGTKSHLEILRMARINGIDGTWMFGLFVQLIDHSDSTSAIDTGHHVAFWTIFGD